MATSNPPCGDGPADHAPDRTAGKAGGRAGNVPGLSLNQVIDHALLDRDGHRAGRVDDLLLEFGPAADSEQSPALILRSLVSGPLPRPTSKIVRLLATASYRLLGIRNPGPVTLPWSHVSAIDALVHLDIDRDEAGLRTVETAAGRIIRKIRGSGRG